MLAESGVVRSDIRSSFGDMSGTAAGVPPTDRAPLVDAADGGAPLAGAAVYLWHCDREGRYSLYSAAIADQNYLRGVQVADADGTRHVHYDLPRRLLGPLAAHPLRGLPQPRAATGGAPTPPHVADRDPRGRCDLVFATEGYEQSVTNLAQMSLDRDIVFADGYGTQLASWSGEAKSGIDLRLNVGV